MKVLGDLSGIVVSGSAARYVHTVMPITAAGEISVIGGKTRLDDAGPESGDHNVLSVGVALEAGGFGVVAPISGVVEVIYGFRNGLASQRMMVQKNDVTFGELYHQSVNVNHGSHATLASVAVTQGDVISFDVSAVSSNKIQSFFCRVEFFPL